MLNLLLFVFRMITYHLFRDDIMNPYENVNIQNISAYLDLNIVCICFIYYHTMQTTKRWIHSQYWTTSLHYIATANVVSIKIYRSRTVGMVTIQNQLKYDTYSPLDNIAKARQLHCEILVTKSKMNGIGGIGLTLRNTNLFIQINRSIETCPFENTE